MVRRFIARVVLAAAAASLVAAAIAEAQIIRRPVPRPVRNWGGASLGLLQNFSIVDGSTGSTWEFGSGLEYAARFERPISSGELAVGLQATYARLPLVYSSSIFSGEAKADVTQLMAVLRYGGGYSFHPVYELAVGAIGFSDFESESGQKISSSTDYDPKISIGYGFGFGISPRASIDIVQELGTVLHQRDGLAASESNYPRIFVTRLGGKIAF
jgi:hypothetical protein